MNIPLVVTKLNKLVDEKGDVNMINLYKRCLIESIDEAIHQKRFYELKTNILLDVIHEAKITDFNLLCDLVENFSGLKHQTSLSVIMAIDTSQLNYNQYIQLISKFKDCKFSQSLGKQHDREISEIEKRMNEKKNKEKLRKKQLNQFTKDLLLNKKEPEIPPSNFKIGFFDSLKYGELENVQYHIKVLNANPKTDIRDEKKRTVLECAIMSRNLYLVIYLMEKRNVCLPTETTSLLWFVCNYGSYDIFKYLCEKYDLKDSFKSETVMFLKKIAPRNDINFVKYFVEDIKIAGKINCKKIEYSSEIFTYLFKKNCICFMNYEYGLLEAFEKKMYELFLYMLNDKRYELSDELFEKTRNTLYEEPLKPFYNIFKAVEFGSLMLVKRLLQENNKIAFHKKNSLNLMEYALKCNQKEIALYLKENVPYISDDYDYSKFCICTVDNFHEILDMFGKTESDIGDNLIEVLRKAFYIGNIPFLEFILQHYNISTEKKEIYLGTSFILDLVQNENKEAIKYFKELYRLEKIDNKSLEKMLDNIIEEENYKLLNTLIEDGKIFQKESNLWRYCIYSAFYFNSKKVLFDIITKDIPEYLSKKDYRFISCCVTLQTIQKLEKPLINKIIENIKYFNDINRFLLILLTAREKWLFNTDKEIISKEIAERVFEQFIELKDFENIHYLIDVGKISTPKIFTYAMKTDNPDILDFSYFDFSEVYKTEEFNYVIFNDNYKIFEEMLKEWGREKNRIITKDVASEIFKKAYLIGSKNICFLLNKWFGISPSEKFLSKEEEPPKDYKDIERTMLHNFWKEAVKLSFVHETDFCGFLKRVCLEPTKNHQYYFED